MEFNLPKKMLSAERMKPVVLNLLNNLVVPFFNVVISLFIVSTYSLQFWGEYSRAILFIVILTQLSLWGSKDYLLREFSKKPQAVAGTWQQSIASRNIVVVFCAVALFFILPGIALKITAMAILAVRAWYLSYDPVVIYTRHFFSKTVAEIGGNVVFCMLILWSRKSLTLEKFLLLNLFTEITKFILMTIQFRKQYPLPVTLRFDMGHLKISTGFLLLSFTGLLTYRADQLFAASYMNAANFGSYQLLLSFLIVVHAFAGYILQPFLKLLYRSKTAVVFKISQRLFLNGLWISVSAVIVTRYILLLFYHLHISDTTLVFAGLFLLPTFYYSPLLYYCFTLGKEIYVVVVNICGAAVTFICCMVLKDVIGGQLTAVMLSAAISQWLMMITYIIMVNRLTAQAVVKRSP